PGSASPGGPCIRCRTGQYADAAGTATHVRCDCGSIMSDKSTDQQSDERPTAPPNLGMQNTPNAERYVLEADAMRRRQLRSALLHGRRRTWREVSRRVAVC